MVFLGLMMLFYFFESSNKLLNYFHFLLWTGLEDTIPKRPVAVMKSGGGFGGYRMDGNRIIRTREIKGIKARQNKVGAMP